MKRIIAFLTVATMFFSLAACSPSTDSKPPQETPPKATDAQPSTDSNASAKAGGKVGVSMPTKSLQRWNQDGSNMEKQLK
jgi:putative multiple sugar transport system substrate-binding protein